MCIIYLYICPVVVIASHMYKTLVFTMMFVCFKFHNAELHPFSMTLHALFKNKSTLDIVLVNVLCKKSVVFELITLKKV